MGSTIVNVGEPQGAGENSCHNCGMNGQPLTRNHIAIGTLWKHLHWVTIVECIPMSRWNRRLNTQSFVTFACDMLHPKILWCCMWKPATRPFHGVDCLIGPTLSRVLLGNKWPTLPIATPDDSQSCTLRWWWNHLSKQQERPSPRYPELTMVLGSYCYTSVQDLWRKTWCI